jgi:hypothetical protein
MALQWQNVPVDFGDGVDTQTDPKAVLATKLLQAQNVVFTSPGVLKTRNGHALNLNWGGGAGRRLIKHGTRLLGLTDTDHLTVDPALDYHGVGTCGIAGILRQAVMRDATIRVLECDSAVSIDGRYIMIGARCFSNTATPLDILVWVIVDSVSGEVIRRLVPYTATDATHPRIAAVDNFFMCYFFASASGLRRFRFNVTTLAIDVGPVVEDGAATGPIDVAPIGGLTSRFALAYFSGANLQLAAVSAANGNFGLTTVAATGGTDPVAVMATNGEAFYVAWRGGGNLRVRGYSWNGSAFTSLFAATDAAVPWTAGQIPNLVRESSTSALLLWNDLPAFGRYFVTGRTVSNAGALGTAFIRYQRLMISKPWADINGTKRVLIANPEGGGHPYDSTQGTAFVMNLEQGITLGSRAIQIDGIIARSLVVPEVSFGVVPSVPQLTSGKHVAALITRQRGLLVTTGVVTTEQSGVDLVTFDMAAKTRYCTAELGGLTYIAGGQLRCFDGLFCFEAGFAVFPQVPSLAAAAGGSVDVGTHQFVAVYEYTDAQGNVHRSAPSFAGSITIGAGNQTVNATISKLSISNRDAEDPVYTPPAVRLMLYGTPVNSPIFYRLDTPADAPANSIFNDTPSAFPAVTMADATMITLPQLYTAGGVLANYPPPSCHVVAVHQDRLFVISSEDGTIWYSKQYTVGEAPGFNDALQFRVPSSLIPTALASLDDKLIVFTATGPFVVTGSWPTDTGQGLNISIDRIPSDVGATDWRSVLVTGAGVFFGSAKGIMLLTRALEVVYVGKDVESWTSTYSDIVAAYQPASKNEARFVVDDASKSPRSQELVLNHRNKTQASPFGTWSTFDYVGAGWSNTGFISAIVVNGTAYKFVAGGGNLVAESSSSFDDSGAWITVIVETANIWPFGRLGFMRCRTASFRGTYKGQHNLKIDLAYNGDDAFTESTTFADATLAALAREQVSHHLTLQKCSGVRLKLTTLVVSLGNEGLTLSGIVLEVAQKRGSFDRTMPPEARQ